MRSAGSASNSPACATAAWRRNSAAARRPKAGRPRPAWPPRSRDASSARPQAAVLAGIIYTSAAGFVAAAVKLLRLGQNAAQTLLAEGLARTPELIAEALALDTAEIGAFNPWWDIAAARHESADGRLFIS